MAKKNESVAHVLTLTQRVAKIGNSINTWALKVGVERLPCKQLQITTSIDEDELSKLLRTVRASDYFFITAQSKLREPRWKDLIASPFKLEVQYASSFVSLFVGIDRRIIPIVDCTLVGISFNPLDGGRSALKLGAQYRPADDSHTAELDNWLDQEVTIAIEFGKVELAKAENPQQQLPMNDEAKTDGEVQAEALAKSTRAKPGEGKRKRPSRAKVKS